MLDAMHELESSELRRRLVPLQRINDTLSSHLVSSQCFSRLRDDLNVPYARDLKGKLPVG